MKRKRKKDFSDLEIRLAASGLLRVALEDVHIRRGGPEIIANLLSTRPKRWSSRAWSAALLQEALPLTSRFNEISDISQMGHFHGLRLVEGLWGIAQRDKLRPLFFEETSKIVPDLMEQDPFTLISILEYMFCASRTRKSFKTRFYKQIVDVFSQLSRSPFVHEVNMTPNERPGGAELIAKMMRREESCPDRQSELATLGILVSCAQENQGLTDVAGIRIREGQTSNLARFMVGVLGADASCGFVCRDFMLSAQAKDGREQIFVLFGKGPNQTTVYANAFCGSLADFRVVLDQGASRLPAGWLVHYTLVANSAQHALDQRPKLPSFVEAVGALPRLSPAAMRPY